MRKEMEVLMRVFFNLKMFTIWSNQSCLRFDRKKKKKKVFVQFSIVNSIYWMGLAKGKRGGLMLKTFKQKFKMKKKTLGSKSIYKIYTLNIPRWLHNMSSGNDCEFFPYYQKRHFEMDLEIQLELSNRGKKWLDFAIWFWIR